MSGWRPQSYIRTIERMSERSAHDDGFAIRRRWPDGSHDYIRFSRTPGAAQRGVEPDRRYWERGPVRPVERNVVAISRNDFDLHRARRRCRSTDCP
jgi:hypothetical protein